MTSAQRAAHDGTLPASLLAEVAAADGRVLRLEGKPAAAAERYDTAAEQFRRGTRPRDVAAALALAGRCFEEAGSPAAAADRYCRAARSLFAQNDFAASVKTLDSAFAMAEKANDPELKARATDLLNEVQAAVKRKEFKQD